MAADGDSHFFAIAAMLKQLGDNNSGLGFPEMILVSIPNTDKMRDLNPSQDTTGVMLPKGMARRSGGGEK